jgi:hypothetical protein
VGEPIEINYSYTNCRDEQLVLVHDPIERADFAVVHYTGIDGVEVWSNSAGVFDLPQEEAVSPGKTTTWKAIWVDTAALEPGSYGAEARLSHCRPRAASFECPRPASVEFEFEGD